MFAYLTAAGLVVGAAVGTTAVVHHSSCAPSGNTWSSAIAGACDIGGGRNPGQPNPPRRSTDPKATTAGSGNTALNSGRELRRRRAPQPQHTGPQPQRQDRVKNGSYHATVSGFFHGTGNADVSANSISICADVLTEDNKSGQLSASSLTMDGPYFYGTGKLLGNDVYITGRVDAARASRLMAIFSTDDGHNGRIVATLPAAVDPGDDQWDKRD